MSPKTMNVLTVAGVAIVAALAAAAITHSIGRSDTLDLQARLAASESEGDRLNRAIDDLRKTRSAEDSPAEAPSAEPVDDDAAEPAPKKAVQYAFVTAAAESSGEISLTLDYARFLTGEAAAEAARAAGDEPPPNDYWVDNDDATARTLPVEKTAQFVIALNAPEETRTLTAREFLAAFESDDDGVRAAGYWVTLTGEKITGAEEQWLP